jgi:hypothetical protein
VHQQFGAEGPHRAALGRGLEFVQHLGIGEILGDEAMQLRRPEGLQEAVEAQPDHLGVVAAHGGQQPLGPTAGKGIARGSSRRATASIEDLHDHRHRQARQVLRAGRP